MILILNSLLKSYWHDARLTTIAVLTASLIGALASISAPYIFSRAVDDLAHGKIHADAINLLIMYAVLFGCAKSFSLGSRFLIVLCAERLAFIANTTFFARLLHKTPAFFLEYNAAEIGTARQQGTQTLNLITQLCLGGMLPGCVQITFSVLVLGNLLSWDIALIILIYGIVVIALDYARVGIVKPSLDAAMNQGQANARIVGNAIAIVDTLRQTRGESWIINRFTQSASEAFRSLRRYALVSSVFCGLLGIAAALQLTITFLVLLPRFGDGLISIGNIVLFNTLLIQLNEPFHMVGSAIKELVEATARFRPLATMWMAAEELEPDNPLTYRPKSGVVAFENVSFHYSNGCGITNLSFVGSRGTPTFITGETGTGKSTVVRLLLKGLKPTEGHIFADRTDLTCVTNDDWFSHVGVVPQEVTLLNDTLSANIVLGRPFDISRLRRAASRASILRRIEAMPEGFETVVGERGLKLSGGERQRIAIARALYGEPAILVLDEASSALDDDTERHIMDGLRDLADQLTIIAVTHRTSMIQPGDNIVRLPVSLLEHGRH